MSVPYEFAARFNRRDLEALLALFTDHATYHDLFYGEHSGRHAVRALFERMYREGRDHVWTMDAVLESPQHAVAEWTFVFVVSDAIPRSAGKQLCFRGMSIFELEGGRIRAYREYFDKGAQLVRLGFTPESLARTLGRSVQRASVEPEVLT